MKKVITRASFALALFSLVACGAKTKVNSSSKSDNKSFPIVWDTKKEPMKGGVLKVGVASNSPFKGLLSPILSQDTIDSAFLGPITAGLFQTDGDFNIIEGDIAKMEFDVENKIINVKFKEGLKWEDGHPMTVDDYIFTYEVLGHPDYTGVRYGAALENVVGMKEYHEGKAKTIRGLEKISDTEINIHIIEPQPTIRTGSGGLNTSIIPKHYLQDVPVKDLETSAKIRKKPLSGGAWKIKQIIPGESIEYSPNENYYDYENMNLQGAVYKILPETSIISSMKTGEYDIYVQVNDNLYPEYQEFDNIAVLGRSALYYQYLGFNLGHWDDKEKVNVTDKNSKMFNLNLRKAMGYAVNYELITQNLYNGLRTRANSVIPPVFSELSPKEKRFSYEPEKAKQLLDEAGYKDIDGDGFREDQNGKPFEILFAFPDQGPDLTEPLSAQIMQDWRAVGLNVSLATGRAMEANSFFDKVKSNDKGIDVWLAAWSVGSSFDPSGLYDKKAKFNYSRLVSEKNDELIKKVNSYESLKDPEYRKQAIKEWEQNYMENELGFLPVTFRFQLQPINKRLNYYSYSFDSRVGKDIPTGVLAPEPFAATK